LPKNFSFIKVDCIKRSPGRLQSGIAGLIHQYIPSIVNITVGRFLVTFLYRLSSALVVLSKRNAINPSSSFWEDLETPAFVLYPISTGGYLRLFKTVRKIFEIREYVCPALSAPWHMVQLLRV
jgi:hypothetical protein